MRIDLEDKSIDLRGYTEEQVRDIALLCMSRECRDFNVSNSGKKVNIFRVYDVKSIEKAFISMGKTFGVYDRVGEKLDERYEVEYGITVCDEMWSYCGDDAFEVWCKHVADIGIGNIVRRVFVCSRDAYCVHGWMVEDYELYQTIEKIKREVQTIEYSGYAYRVEEILKYVPDSTIDSFPSRADAAKEYVSKYYNTGGVHRLEVNPEPCTEKFFKKEEL